MSKVSKLRRFLRWTAGAFTALLVLFVLCLFLLDLSRFRDKFESVASEALQRSVTIAGDIRLTPGLHPALVVKDLRIANPAWATTPDLVSIQELEIVVSLPSLLMGSLDIRSTRVQGFEAHLETDPTGQKSWVFDRQGGDVIPFVGTLSLNDGHVSYREAAWDSALRIAIQDLSGELSPDRPLRISGHGLSEDQPLSIQLDGGTLAALAEPKDPWPVRIILDAGHAKLDIDGTIANPGKLTGLDLQIVLSGEQFSRLGESFGAAFPALGTVDMKGHLIGDRAELRLADFGARLANNAITGQFRLTTTDARPRLTGRVEAEHLQLEVLGALPYAAAADVASMTPAELMGLSLDLPLLDTVDMALASSVAEVFAGERSIGPWSGKLTLDDSVLAFDLRQGPETDAAAELHITMDGTGDSLVLTLELDAEEVPYGEVLERWKLAEAVSGTTEHIELRVHGEGDTVRDLLETADIDLALRNTDFTYSDWNWATTPTQIASASLKARDGRLEMLHAEGTYHQRAFAVASGQSIDMRDIEQPWPIDLTATYGDASLAAKGTVTQVWRNQELDLSVKMSGQTKVPTSSAKSDSSLTAVPYEINAQLTGNVDGHRLRGLRGKIGASDFSGALAISKTASGGYRLSGNLDAETLAFQQTSAVLVAAAGEGEAKATPEPIELVFLHDNEFDLQLSADRLSQTPVAVSQLRARVIASGGRLSVEPLELWLAGLPLNGRAELDGTGQVPSLSFALTAEKPGAQTLRKSLAVTDDIQLSTKRLHVAGQGAGRTWPELWEQLALNLDAAEARLVFRGNDSPGASLELDHVEARTKPGAPTIIAAQGAYRQVRFRLNATGGAILAPNKVEEWPIRLAVEASDALLEIDGSLAGPLDVTTPDVRWSLKGDDIETLEGLLGFQPGGSEAYSFSGTLTGAPDRYELKELEVVLGPNDLTGHIVINTDSEPIQFSAELQSKYLNIDRLTQAAGDTAEPSSTDDTLIANPTLFPAHPANFDAQIALAMERVVVAGFELHDASVTAEMEHGQLIVGKHQATVAAGGSVEFHHQMGAEGTHLAFRAYPLNLSDLLDVDEEDPTAEWPADIDIDLTGQGTTLHELLSSSDGHIAFTAGALKGTNAYIERIRTGLFEIMFPRMTADARARLNCVVMDLDVANGIAKAEQSVYDTSSATVFITGTLKLESETLNLVLTPRPKQPRLLDVATPVQMTNTLADPKFSVASGELALTASSLPIRAPLHLPLVSNLLAATGDQRDPCIQAYQEGGGTVPANEADEDAEQRGGIVRGIRKAFGGVFGGKAETQQPSDDPQ